MDYYRKMYSDKKKQHITFFFLQYCITPYIAKMDTEDYDTYTQIHKARLFHNFYLPFGYKITRRIPYTLKKNKYEETEAKKILERRLQEKITEFEEKGVEIIRNDVKINMADGKMIARGTFTLNESIGRFKKASGRISRERIAD